MRLATLVIVLAGCGGSSSSRDAGVDVDLAAGSSQQDLTSSVDSAFADASLANDVNAPPAAAALGLETLTFGPEVTYGQNWYDWNFYGAGAQAANAVSQNADGTLFITGNENNNYGSTVASGYQNSKSDKSWSGVAFGGATYFEAVLSFTGQGNGPFSNGGPAFWALDIEHLSQGPYTVNWPGQAADYDDYFEVDFMEYDVSEYAFQNGIGNWYGNPAVATSNPYEDVAGATGSVKVSTSTDFSQLHKYGCLWVPATPTKQGYLSFYFDDTILPDSPFVWNYDDPSHPFAPPPVNMSTAMAGMDQRHMLMILGTGTTQPMTVKSVSVWQKDATNNLVQP